MLQPCVQKKNIIWGLGRLARFSVSTVSGFCWDLGWVVQTPMYKGSAPRSVPCSRLARLTTLSLLASVSSLHTESNSTALLHWSTVQMETSDGKMFVWQMESGIKTDKPWNTRWTLSMHLAFLRCSVRLHAPFLAFCTICKVMQLERGSGLTNRLGTFTVTGSG